MGTAPVLALFLELCGTRRGAKDAEGWERRGRGGGAYRNLGPLTGCDVARLGQGVRRLVLPTPLRQRR